MTFVWHFIRPQMNLITTLLESVFNLESIHMHIMCIWLYLSNLTPNDPWLTLYLTFKRTQKMHGQKIPKIRFWGQFWTLKNMARFFPQNSNFFYQLTISTVEYTLQQALVELHLVHVPNWTVHETTDCRSWISGHMILFESS